MIYFLQRVGIAQSVYRRATGWFDTWRRQEILLYSVPAGSRGPTPFKMGTGGGSFPAGEVDHSPPSSAKVKNGGAIPPLPQCIHDTLLN
jgi:hypothetical protein